MNTFTFSRIFFTKRNSWIAFFLIFAGFSCNKDNSVTPSYHVTCTIDGVNQNFSARCFAQINYLNGKKQLSIGGLNDSDWRKATAAVAFTILNDVSTDSITLGTYMDTSTLFEVLAGYTLYGAGGVIAADYAAGTSTYQEALTAGFTPTNHFKAVITSWTSNAVRGTFSGDFYSWDSTAIDPNKKRVITNGDFYVKIE